MLRHEVLEALASRKDLERLFSGLGALVLIPAVFGLLGIYHAELETIFGVIGVVVIWVMAVLILAAFAVRLHLPERSIHALLVENERLTGHCHELREDVDQLQAAISGLSIQVNFCESARAMTLAHAGRNIRDLASFREALNDICAPIYLENEEIFGFGSSERWSFAVYLYSQRTDELIPVWRQKAPNHPSTDNGRVFQRGEGHVGKAFVDRRAIVTGDAYTPEASEFSALPPGREKDYDRYLYVSFAAIPIGPILDEDSRPYGVVVGTSDRQGRFDRENTGILLHIAGVIASLLIVGKLDVDVFDSGNEAGAKDASVIPSIQAQAASS